MSDLREQLQNTLGDSLVLEDELGGGGMSRVFVAHEPALGRKVVVKVLPPEMAQAVSIDRFRREIQLAAQLQHPHIVPLLSAGDTNGLPYFTMPYVRGESLRAKLMKAGELPMSETVRTLREVASALAYAHDAGIVHRDIKPENILISGGSAVVTDFGVAKALTASGGANASATSLGVALGTPAYMAPEQATADPSIDRRADIYSLGVVAYEMLTGATPFPGRSPQATLAAHVTESPEAIARRRPTIPPQLAALVMKCLEKHAADRPQSATDVMHELDALSTPTGGTTPTTMLAPAKKSRGAGKLLGVGAGAAALIALALVASYKVQQAAMQKREEVPAIAVLPFENVGRPDGKEFADGMTEEITNRLASLHGLRVIGRQSAKSYAGSTKTPQQIANELGVKYVLTGTVRWDRSPDGKDLVRVSPALLRTDDATQLWAEAYQTVLSGIFDVQSKVAAQVASALNLTLLAPERAALGVKPTDNREAYSLFLRAKGILDNTFQAGPLRDAITMLEKATALDPKFAIGWAYLAASHVELFWFGGDPTQARLTRARQALDRAISLDADLPEVHIAHGIFLYHGERNYDAAIREFEAVQRLRPSDPDAPLYLAAIQRRLGKWDESVLNFKRAAELNPRSGSNILDLASTLVMLNRYQEAESYVDEGMIIAPEEPEGPRLKSLIALAFRQNVPEAIEHMRNAVQTVRPQSSLINVLLANPWPALEDPSLKAIILSAQYSPDMTRGAFYTGKANVMMHLGDVARARSYADSALPALVAEEGESRQPALVFENMAIAQSILGHKREALDMLARSEASLPTSLDALIGSDRENAKILILTYVGDYAGAIAQMEKRVNAINGVSRTFLKLNPLLAPMRANPAFQRLVNQ